MLTVSRPVQSKFSIVRLKMVSNIHSKSKNYIEHLGFFVDPFRDFTPLAKFCVFIEEVSLLTVDCRSTIQF